MSALDKRLEELRKALEAGNHNARPTKLRQGCVTLVNADGTPCTEEEYEAYFDGKEATQGRTP